MAKIPFHANESFSPDCPAEIELHSGDDDDFMLRQYKYRRENFSNMIKLTFDIRGNLFPYERTTFTINDFEEIFVKSFEAESSRHVLFDRYVQYLHDFQNLVNPNFTQWINGSFVTNKTKPRDIDLVTLIDYKSAAQKGGLIQERFENLSALKHYGLDAYLVRVYPSDHPFAIRTQSDLMYWDHWFSKSTLNRAKQRFPKGYVEIHFSE